MKYFAYGSNMLTTRLSARVDSVSNPRRYALSSYKLCFNKRSADGSAKCNIMRSDKPGDVVHGVIFDIDEEQIPNLDQYEGVGYGYTKKQFRLCIDRIEHDVLAYIADANYIDDTLVLYKWYLDLIVAGAEEHGLPRDYASAICNVQFKTDPESHRKTRIEALTALKKYGEDRDQPNHQEDDSSDSANASA